MDFNLSNIGGGTALNFFRKRYPYTSVRDYPYKHDEKKLKKYKLLSLAAIACVMFYFFALPIFYSAVFAKIAEPIHRGLLNDGDVYYAPTWVMYILSAMPFSFGTLLFHYEWTFKLFLQSEYEEFEDYYNDAQKYDNHKAGMLFSKIFLIITVFTLPFTFSSRLVMHNDSVTIKRFYEVCATRYSFSEVAQILYYDKETNRAGVIKYSPHYQIYFTDSSKMNLQVYSDNVVDTKAFVSLLSKRSNIEISRRDIEYFE